MANPYHHNDRVWVQEEGFDWWPARVASREEIGDGISADADCLVIYYAGTETGQSLSELRFPADSHRITFFETSSEKAVTVNADLRAAIDNAAADTSANPLKSAAEIMAISPTPTAAQRPAAKRSRVDEAAADRRPVSESAAGAYIRLPSDVLVGLASRIRTAVQQGDVPALRLNLAELDNVQCSLVDLEETKIGVAVGSILGSPSCRQLWPLARALISFWAMQLPQATLEAIKRVQAATVSSTAAVVEPTSPIFGSPLAGLASPFGPSSAPTLGSSASAPTLNPNVRQRSSFLTSLSLALDDPVSSVRVSSEKVDEVARELAKVVVGADNRYTLIARLRNPDLSYVRENLLSEKWTAHQYSEMSDEAFVTAKERADEEERVRRKLEEMDAASLANVNITALWTCKNCGKKRCSFYEQQTRGADEPTTKFITCLECKTTWTEE